jgi:ABC-type glutathione transport system ATPase component
MWSEATERELIAPLSSDTHVPQPKAKAMNAFLKIEKLGKAYQSDKPVFSDVSFTIDKGEFVCIIGHSGCGKTTILNVLAGLDTADVAALSSSLQADLAARAAGDQSTVDTSVLLAQLQDISSRSV